jgi:hypothetical protein
VELRENGICPGQARTADVAVCGWNKADLQLQDVSGRLQVIILQQSSQALRAKNFLGAGWLLRKWWFLSSGKRHVVASLMRACAVVIALHEFIDETLEMSFVEYDEMLLSGQLGRGSSLTT